MSSWLRFSSIGGLLYPNEILLIILLTFIGFALFGKFDLEGSIKYQHLFF